MIFQGDTSLNENLLKKINDGGKIHMVPSKLRGVFILRFAVCSRYTESHDVILAWNEIRSLADQLLLQYNNSNMQQ